MCSSVGRTQVVPIEADAPASAGGVAVDVNNDSPSGWGRAERANAKRRMKQGAVDALTQKAPSSEAIQRATKTGSAKVRFLVADENNWEALLDVRRAILRNSAQCCAIRRNSLTARPPSTGARRQRRDRPPLE